MICLPVLDEIHLIIFCEHRSSFLNFIYFADFLFKFLVIGSAGTGKSCILHQFIEGKCKLLHCMRLTIISNDRSKGYLSVTSD